MSVWIETFEFPVNEIVAYINYESVTLLVSSGLLEFCKNMLSERKTAYIQTRRRLVWI